MEIPCGICGSREHSPHWDCGDFKFARCQSCGVIYQNPQPVQEDLLERYNQEYFSYERENEEKFFRLMLQGLEDVNFVRHEASLTGERRFLDIGCATGLLLAHIKGRGWQVQGVEVCRPAAELGIAERKVPIHVGTLETAGFPADWFDVIHFSHLIEHLNQPIAFLREVARVLKPGGRILITTPNADGFQAWLFQDRWRSAIADHLYLFSRKTLSQALELAGLKLKKTVTWGGLAVGTAPTFLKRGFDFLAKPLAFGDVMLMEAVKPAFGTFAQSSSRTT